MNRGGFVMELVQIEQLSLPTLLMTYLQEVWKETRNVREMYDREKTQLVDLGIFSRGKHCRFYLM